MLKHKSLGRTDKKIPAIGQGTMGIGGCFTPDASFDKQHVKLLRMGIDLGMTLIDTAEVYGGGHSEELVAEAVRGIREQVFIATKFSPENNTYDGVIKSAEGSLRRMKTDWIDLYQVHWPNPTVPIEETLRAMERLVKDGKVRHIGVSNFSLKELKDTKEYMGDKIVSLQIEYNLFDRTAEQDILPFCKQHHLILIAYSPLNQGKTPGNKRKKAELSELAKKYRVSVSQLILNWLLRNPCVVAIPKSSNEIHLRENSNAHSFKMEIFDYEHISKLFEQNVCHIFPDLIEVSDSSNRRVYKTLEEAIENRFNLVPSPMELAEQIEGGEILKPIKLKRNENHFKNPTYQLIEGRVRFWAWVIVTKGKTPIPALVEETE